MKFWAMWGTPRTSQRLCPVVYVTFPSADILEVVEKNKQM